MACASGVISILHLNSIPSILCGTDACGALRAGLTLRPSCLRTTDATVARGARRNSDRQQARWIDRRHRRDHTTPSEMPASCWRAGPHKTCSNLLRRRCQHRWLLRDVPAHREAAQCPVVPVFVSTHHTKQSRHQRLQQKKRWRRHLTPPINRLSSERRAARKPVVHALLRLRTNIYRQRSRVMTSWCEQPSRSLNRNGPIGRRWRGSCAPMAALDC